MKQSSTRKDLINEINRFQTVLERAFLREELSGDVIYVAQGGLTITFTIFMSNARITGIRKALTLGEVLAQEAGVESVRVFRDTHGMVFEFPSPLPQNPHADNLAGYMMSDEVCVGFDGMRNPITINMRRNPNILFVGAPRVGKTSAVRSILYAMIKQLNGSISVPSVKFLILAEKLMYWRVFQDRRGVVGVHSDKDTISLKLHQLSQEVGEKAKTGAIFDPPIYLVIDDLLRLISQDKSIVSAMSEILSTGASVGVYVIFITQSGGTNLGTGGAIIEDTVACRVIYKQTSNSAAARATGMDAQGITDLTSYQGDCVVVLNNTTHRAVTAFVEDQDVYQLPVEHTASPFTVTDEESPAALTLELPKITPARPLTNEEVLRVREVLQFFVRQGKPLSKNYVVVAVYGGKNTQYLTWINEVYHVVVDKDKAHLAQ